MSKRKTPGPEAPEFPQAGGSWVRQPDGSLACEERTAQPDDPEHERNRRDERGAAAAEPEQGAE